MTSFLNDCFHFIHNIGENRSVIAFAINRVISVGLRINHIFICEAVHLENGKHDKFFAVPNKASLPYNFVNEFKETINTAKKQTFASNFYATVDFCLV